MGCELGGEVAAILAYIDVSEIQRVKLQIRYHSKDVAIWICFDSVIRPRIISRSYIEFKF